MNELAYVDGRVCAASELDAREADGVFETMGAWRQGLPLWEAHLRRLRAGARALRLRWRPPGHLQRAARELLRHNQHDVVRVAIERRRHAGRWVMTTRARDREPEPLRVVLAPQARAAGAHHDRKLCRRAVLVAARAHARALGAHDALLWRDGLLLEATAYNVFVLVGDRLLTPPADGSILPGIGRARLLASSLPIHEQRVAVEAVAESPLVVLSNAVYGPRWAYLGEADPAAAQAFLPALRAAWSAVTGA